MGRVASRLVWGSVWPAGAAASCRGLADARAPPPPPCCCHRSFCRTMVDLALEGRWEGKVREGMAAHCLLPACLPACWPGCSRVALARCRGWVLSAPRCSRARPGPLLPRPHPKHQPRPRPWTSPTPSINTLSQGPAPPHPTGPTHPPHPPAGRGRLLPGADPGHAPPHGLLRVLRGGLLHLWHPAAPGELRGTGPTRLNGAQFGDGAWRSHWAMRRGGT